MRGVANIGVRVAAAGALVVFCGGCPDPNVYGTPRTTPVGKVSQTVAVQGAAYGFDNSKQVGGISTIQTTPFPPTYLLRVGLLDRLDIGVHIAHASTVGVDFKWNFLKTPIFDMAIDPGVQAWFVESCTDGGGPGQLYSSLPLLFGINLSDSVSLVPTLGITYGCAGRAAVFESSPSDGGALRGVMLRAGFGVEARVTPRFALHPEVTYLKYLGSNSEPAVSWAVFGIGFNFGALPELDGP